MLAYCDRGNKLTEENKIIEVAILKLPSTDCFKDYFAYNFRILEFVYWKRQGNDCFMSETLFLKDIDSLPYKPTALTAVRASNFLGITKVFTGRRGASHYAVTSRPIHICQGVPT